MLHRCREKGRGVPRLSCRMLLLAVVLAKRMPTIFSWLAGSLLLEPLQPVGIFGI